MHDGSEQIIFRLNEITADYNFINVIGALVLRDFCGPLDYLEHRSSRDHFNYNEASFLIGLWIKNANPSNRERYEFSQRFAETYELMEKLHFTFISEGPKIESELDPAVFLTNGFLLKEAFFYASTGAYDYQYINKFKQKYGRDEVWLIDNKGFGLSSPPELFKHVKNSINKKLNDSRMKGKSRPMAADLIFPFIFSRNELTNQNPEFEKIISPFIIELSKGHNSQLSSVGDFNEFQTKPIIKLREDEYFIPIPFYLAEALYESPFYWMASDKSYVTQCLLHRGLIAEEIAYTSFESVFGPENTFKDIIITENRSRTITDIDVCAIYNEIAVVVQVKSKKLTALSKQGDVKKIKDDFKKAVEDSFVQGLECEKAILNSFKFNFVLNATGEDVQNKFSNIRSVYIVCVVLDVFPGLCHLSNILLHEKFNESTICFSVFDLEVICRYLNTPIKLVDYLSKRIKNCRYYHADNELCFLGFYLQHGLKKYDKYDAVLIENDYGNKIDRLYYPEISGYKEQFQKRKIGRNEKCPCGSGLKYKYCHGRN